jgi:hypothetical protein
MVGSAMRFRVGEGVAEADVDGGIDSPCRRSGRVDGVNTFRAPAGRLASMSMASSQVTPISAAISIPGSSTTQAVSLTMA